MAEVLYMIVYGGSQCCAQDSLKRGVQKGEILLISWMLVF